MKHNKMKSSRKHTFAGWEAPLRSERLSVVTHNWQNALHLKDLVVGTLTLVFEALGSGCICLPKTALKQ